MAGEQQKFASGDPAESITPAASAPAVAPAATDLSAEIIATIAKEPGDRVRCTWVAGNNYRCNWWAPGSRAAYDNPAMTGLTVTTHVVRQSRFLTVTKVAGRLVIRDHSMSRQPAGSPVLGGA